LSEISILNFQFEFLCPNKMESVAMNSISKESVSDIFSILSDKPNLSNLSEIFDLE